MNDPNRLAKWIFVIVLVALAIARLYPPNRTLKGGIDLVGGTSLLLEIDTTGLDRTERSGIASRVMDILKKRVDPKGQLNLEWRPVGDTRLEIRMPRPPKEALERRERKEDALNQIAARNLRRFDVEEALSSPAGEREGKLARLAGASDERQRMVDDLKNAYDAKGADETDEAARETAKQQYEKAMVALLSTNAPVNRLVDILSIGPGEKRETELTRFRNEFPAYDEGTLADEGGKLISKATTAYDAWAESKADLEDPSDLKRRIRGAGVLEFRILAERDPSSPTNLLDPKGLGEKSISKFREKLAKVGPRLREGERFGWFAIEDPIKFMQGNIKSLEDVRREMDSPLAPVVGEYAGRFYVLAYNSAEQRMLKGTGDKKWQLKTAFPDRDMATGRSVVSFALDSRGGRQFGRLTGGNVEKDLCIILDNVAVSYANIRERITERCQISGDFSPERINDIVTTLSAGSLPARLKEEPLMENTVGPTLGEANRRYGLQAAVIGAVAVAIFVLLYYGIAAGGMANFALAMNLLFVLAIMAFLEATFTLPGIAGLILTVGMAIDANVLIFERVREERARGVIFKKALNAGYDKAFSTIMDANLTTLLTCIILGFVGSEEVKGFAITLGIGIVTSIFTTLFVTRLIFNTLISKNLLKDLSMRSIVGVPTVDWLSLRSKFWPVSLVVVLICATAFIGLSSTNKEAIYDIEFLGGTAVQLDLKPGIEMTDDEINEMVSNRDGGSASSWLQDSTQFLANVKVEAGETARSFVVESPDNKLTGSQIGTLLSSVIGNKIAKDGIDQIRRNAVAIEGKAGELDVDAIKAAVTEAQARVQKAAERMQSARVQSVGVLEPGEESGKSYEVVTIETNRQLVQTALMAALGDRLKVQRAIRIDVKEDFELLNESFFVVESEDEYLSDVLGGDASYDVRRFRGGVAVAVTLDPDEQPAQLAEMERRLREHVLQVGADDARTLDTAVFPIGAGSSADGYREFAFLAVDESYLYDEVGEELWKDALAKMHLDHVQAALSSEKSFSKVVQFAPQIADQARNRAVISIILALGAIVAYLSLRFGTKEYGLAAIVALVHDVSITIGLVALSRLLAGTFLGDLLLLEAFRIDLPMIAAILTVIGYSLNDTIVVFDRIRENRGKVGKLQAATINNSINQTLSRTVLTSVTTFLAVSILYVFGGDGVHGFSFALMIGVIVGTYSSLGIATPLLYRPALLMRVIAVIVAIAIIGVIFLATDNQTGRIIASLVTLGVLGYIMTRGSSGAAGSAGRPATA